MGWLENRITKRSVKLLESKRMLAPGEQVLATALGQVPAGDCQFIVTDRSLFVITPHDGLLPRMPLDGIVSVLTQRGRLLIREKGGSELLVIFRGGIPPEFERALTAKLHFQPPAYEDE